MVSDYTRQGLSLGAIIIVIIIIIIINIIIIIIIIIQWKFLVFLL